MASRRCVVLLTLIDICKHIIAFPPPVGGFVLHETTGEHENRTEYEGALDVDERLVADLVASCRRVAAAIKTLPPLQEDAD